MKISKGKALLERGLLGKLKRRPGGCLSDDIELVKTEYADRQPGYQIRTTALRRSVGIHP
jgi:hypothetical protein